MKLRKIDLLQIDEKTKNAYKQLLIADAVECFEEWDHYLSATFIEASINEIPIGVAFALSETSRETSRLVSLFVKEEERERKVGHCLLSSLEDELIQQGCKAMYAEYPSDTPYHACIERLLTKHGWAKPATYMLCCHFDVRLFNPPWFNRPIGFSKEFQEFSWNQLTDKEKEILRYQAKQWTFPPAVSPLIQEETIEPLNSLGLRYQNEVIGWMITHRIDPQTISYTSLYIHREYHLQGHAIQLLVNSIRKQQHSSIPYALFKVNIEEVSPSWYRFVKNRLAPYAQKVQKIKWTWRSLMSDDFFD